MAEVTNLGVSDDAREAVAVGSWRVLTRTRRAVCLRTVREEGRDWLQGRQQVCLSSTTGVEAPQMSWSWSAQWKVFATSEEEALAVERLEPRRLA